MVESDWLSNLLTCKCIPEANGLVTISSSADDVFSVGAEGNTGYRPAMSCEWLADLFSRVCIPDA